MAQIYRPPYTDKKTGKRKKSRTWHIRFYGPDGVRQRVKGYKDKAATQALATELERRAARLAAGILDPTEAHAKKPLQEHLDDYKQFLLDKRDTPKHAALTFTRVLGCLDGCQFVKTADISPSKVLSFLSDLREAGKSVATCNYYLTAFRGFTRWLWKDGRILADPLAGMSRLAGQSQDVRRERRELHEDEVRWLLDATAGSKKLFRGLIGLDRAMLYQLALATGFRVNELASLTPADFRLNETPPIVRLRADDAKNGKEAFQPIPSDLANVLRDYLTGKPEAIPLWPGSWKNISAKMLRMDLAAARRLWLQSFRDDKGRNDASHSNFLTYQDAEGRYADFHALRHSYVSRVVRTGASPKTAQILARHSDIRLTLGRYAHAALHDLSAAVEALPSLSSPKPDSKTMKATGTDGKNLSPNLSPQTAKARDFLRQAESEMGCSGEGRKTRKSPEKPLCSGDSLAEAPPGFEPGMADLQSAALPLG